MTILELPIIEVPELTAADVGYLSETTAVPTLASCGAYLKAYETAAYEAKREYIEQKLKVKLALFEQYGYVQPTEPLRKTEPVEVGPPPTPDQVANVLERMRKVLRTNGWTQGSMVLKGKRCLLGALHFALNGTDEGSQYICDNGALHEACLAALVQGCDPITGRYIVAFPSERLKAWQRVERRSNMARVVYVWNDHPRRNHREVQKMLKRQIKALRRG